MLNPKPNSPVSFANFIRHFQASFANSNRRSNLKSTDLFSNLTETKISIRRDEFSTLAAIFPRRLEGNQSTNLLRELPRLSGQKKGRKGEKKGNSQRITRIVPANSVIPRIVQVNRYILKSGEARGTGQQNKLRRLIAITTQVGLHHCLTSLLNFETGLHNAAGARARPLPRVKVSPIRSRKEKGSDVSPGINACKLESHRAVSVNSRGVRGRTRQAETRKFEAEIEGRRASSVKSSFPEWEIDF